jgi:intracellular septation protein A
VRTGIQTETGQAAGVNEVGGVGEVAGTSKAVSQAMSQPDSRGAGQLAGGGLSRLKGMLPMLIGNVVLPYLIYAILGNNGFSVMTALTASALPPLVMTAFTALRKRKLEALGMISLATIAVAIVTSMLSGNARFMLAKDGLFPLVLGLAMLGSLLVGKPLIFYVIRTVFAADNPTLLDRLNRAWAHAGYRREMRTYTALAGLVLLVVVTVQVTCAFTLPVGFAMPMLNIFQLVASAALVMGIRHALRKSMGRYLGQSA